MFTQSAFIALSLVTFGTSIFVVSYLMVLIKSAAKNAGAQSNRTAVLFIAGLVAWPLMALTVSTNWELDFPVLGAMLVLPLLIGSAAILLEPIFKILVKIPLHALVALSFYRVVGLVFLVLYYAGTETLSRGFALNAGWGDVITGVLALPVAWLLWKGKPFAGIALIGWSIFGIADLILAPASAFLFGPGQLVAFPLSFIPVFLGPPFGIFLHLVTLRVAWLQRSEGAFADASTHEVPVSTSAKLSSALLIAVGLILASPNVDANAQSNQQAISAFKKADRNKSGALEKGEFRVFIRAMAKLGNKNAARAVRFGSVGYGVAFRDADKNRNGSVTLQEVAAIR